MALGWLLNLGFAAGEEAEPVTGAAREGHPYHPFHPTIGRSLIWSFLLRLW